MAPARLRTRVGKAEIVGVFRLAGYDLRFHKVGQDGSAKCDAYQTGADDVVEGVVFDLDSKQVPVLDLVEGLGYGYERRSVELFNAEGETLEAFTYIASRVDASLRPFSWYRHHVLVGARSAGLSPEYIARIEGVLDTEDLDTTRVESELRIYGK